MIVVCVYKGSLNASFRPGAAGAARGEGSHAKDSRGEAPVSGSQTPRTLAARRRAARCGTAGLRNRRRRRASNFVTCRKPLTAGRDMTLNREYVALGIVNGDFLRTCLIFSNVLFSDWCGRCAPHWSRLDRLKPEISGGGLVWTVKIACLSSEQCHNKLI